MASKSSKPLFTPLEKKGIFSLSGILFCRMSGLFLIVPVFSALAMDLASATPALVGLAMGGYALTSALLQVPFGLWSDRHGRRAILGLALVLFCAGSLLGAMADNIYLMILARLLQGAGAVSAPIFALIADLTRPEVRARANAALGASVGMSFGIAVLVSPLIVVPFGLSGLFWVVTALALASMVVLLLFVPRPLEQPRLTKESFFQLMPKVLGHADLRIINLGAFVINMGLSVTFFFTPLLLKEAGWQRKDWWMIYLGMLAAGFMIMMPSVILAEAKNRFKQVMILGACLGACSFLVLWLVGAAGFWFRLLPLVGFFMAFNVFEPLFPSLVTRLTGPETKGTASGVYNFCQFMGQFAGAALGGLLYKSASPWLFLGMALLCGLFVLRLTRFQNPVREIPRTAVVAEAG